MNKTSVIYVVKDDNNYSMICDYLKSAKTKVLIELVFVTDFVSDALKSLEQEYPDKVVIVSCDEGSSTAYMLNTGIDYASGEEIFFSYAGCNPAYKGRKYRKSLILEFGLQFPEEIEYGFVRFFDNVYKLFSEENKEEQENEICLDEYHETIKTAENYLVDNFLAIRSYGDIVLEYKKDKFDEAEKTAYIWLLEVVSKCMEMGETPLLLSYLPAIREGLLALFPEIEFLTYAMSDISENNMFLLSVLRGILPNKNTIKSIICVSGSENCVGCTACRGICPVSAIEMTKNYKDSYVAEVIEKLCIGCGKCQKVCPAIKRNTSELSESVIIGLKPYDERHREESMSAGAFGCIAERFIEKFHGVVYGVKLSDDLEVKYDRAGTIEEVKSFKGSKYVQANVANIVSRIEEDLMLGRKVFIGGTSCHIHGLLYYLDEKEIDRKNLFTADLICHGVTVPIIYHRYLGYLKEMYDSPINNFIFRDKKNYGWSSVVETIEFKNEKIVHSEKYAEFLNHNLALNNSCYSCAFAKFERYSDITVGDFWGVQNKKPEWFDDRGISLFIKRTDNGEELWNLVENQFEKIITTREECLQPNLERPTSRPSEYRNFWRDYFNYPTRAAMKKYQTNPYARIANANILTLIKKQINEGDDWRKRFLSLGIKKVALYGNKDINAIVATRVALSGIHISAMENYPEDVLKLTDSIEPEDTVIITDEEFMTEILMDFGKVGFDLTRIIPISYLVLEEATVND